MRAKKAESKRAWARRNPEKVRTYRRTYHLKRTPGYVEGYQRANAKPERQAAKRAFALQRYYERHPERPAPVCRLCGASIPFTGKGRPRVTCGSRGQCPSVAVGA